MRDISNKDMLELSNANMRELSNEEMKAVSGGTAYAFAATIVNGVVTSQPETGARYAFAYVINGTPGGRAG